MSLSMILLIAAFVVWILEESNIVTRRLSIGLVILALFLMFWSA